MNATAPTATNRFHAARSAGRYRVFETISDTEDREVAVCASRAKAEERAAKLNADAEPWGIPAVPEVGPERIAEMVQAEAEYRAEVGVTAPVTATPAASKAPELVNVYVGASVAALVMDRTADADPATASVAAKLRDRQPNAQNYRHVKLSPAERTALAGIATDIENTAVTSGAGALARAARTLRARIAAA